MFKIIPGLFQDISGNIREDAESGNSLLSSFCEEQNQLVRPSIHLKLFVTAGRMKNKGPFHAKFTSPVSNNNVSSRK